MFNRDKFKALVHYICWKCEDPSKLGAVKLNKVLWFTDTVAFTQHGAPVTGARYTKQMRGPVPKAILPVLRDLEAEGKVDIRDVEYHGYAKKEFVAREEPDFDGLTEDEVALVDRAIEFVCDRNTASSISELTHDSVWKLARMGDEIPYSAVLASDLGNLTAADVTRAVERMEYAAA